MSDVERLATRIANCTGPTQVVCFAAYPRDRHTGRLVESGEVITELLEVLCGRPEDRFRVLHDQAAVLLPPHECDEKRIRDACRRASRPAIEVRAIVASVDGPRAARWLSDLLGDLSRRSNFGTFSADPVWRAIDGEVS